VTIATKPFVLGSFDLLQVLERSAELQAMVERGGVRVCHEA
jgi:hypothetical protein